MTESTIPKMQFENKNMVVDTSSLLVDGTGLLKKMQNCTIVVPSIVVYELEDIRRRNGIIGNIARQWLRFFEELRVEHGVRVADGVFLPNYDNLILRIQPNDSSQTILPQHLQNGSADSTILAVAKRLMTKDPNTITALLSNDVPMRLHATLDLDLEAYDAGFFESQVIEPYTGREYVYLTQEEYSNSPLVQGNEMDEIGLFLRPYVNPNITHSLVEVTLDETGQTVKRLLKTWDSFREISHKKSVGQLDPQSVEQKVALDYLLEDPDELPLVSLGGSAGTGKTLLTLAAAVCETNAGNYQKILVLRSLHEMGKGQELGFLPGSVEDKMAPWAGAINDALEVINTKDTPTLEVSPITYLRGRSLHNTFIILEEAQNFSRNEILNVVSRVGMNSKLVMTFDAAQVDNPFLSAGDKSEIWPLIDRLKSEDFAHITLVKTERSRTSELASKILDE